MPVSRIGNKGIVGVQRLQLGIDITFCGYKMPTHWSTFHNWSTKATLRKPIILIEIIRLVGVPFICLLN